MLAEMSGGDLAGLVAIISAVAAAVVMTYATARLVRCARRLRATCDELANEGGAAVAALAAAAEMAKSELGRSNRLLDRADDISSTLHDASKLTYLAVSSPVIKAAALASGVREGARRLRRAPQDGDRALPSRSKRS